MSSLLICDTGPLIILAKLGVLCKWLEGLGYQTVVADVVVRELKRGPFLYGELEEIDAFLKQAKVVSAPKASPPLQSLSLQDQASLRMAGKMSGSLLLADDLLLRRAAQREGIPVIGFPGLLLLAVKKRLLKTEEGVKLLDEAIDAHNYRISIPLYRALQKELGYFNRQ